MKPYIKNYRNHFKSSIDDLSIDWQIGKSKVACSKDESILIEDEAEENTIVALIKCLEEFKKGHYKSFKNADEMAEYLR